MFAAQPAWTSLPGRLTSSRAEHVTAAGGFTSASGPSGRRSALPGRAISCRTEIASVLRTSFQAVVGTLSLPVAPSIRFPLPQKFGSRSQRSSAFAAGQVKRQVTPEGA